MSGIVYTSGSNRVVRHWIPDGATEPSAAWLSTQFPSTTLTKRTLADDQVLSGGAYPVGRVASASTTAATLSDLVLTTNQMNTLNTGLRQRAVRSWLRSFYDLGVLNLISNDRLDAVNKVIEMVAVAASHQANVLTRFQHIDDWLELSPYDIVKNIRPDDWKNLVVRGASGTANFYQFATNGGATLVNATFFLTGDDNTALNFIS